MFYTIYKITNKINGKIYIGKHQTKDPDDDYMGSGKLIRAAIEKYGIENFEKEVLFIFDTEDEMNSKESELVTEDFVKEDTNYNLCPGGNGGFGYINSNEEIISRRDTYKNKLAGRKAADKAIVEKYGSDYPYEQIVSAGALGAQAFKHKYDTDLKFQQETRQRLKDWSERAQTPEAREKRKRTMKENGHNRGAKNPNYGKRWIHSIEEKKSLMISVTEPLPEGWSEGRKVKFR